MRANLSICPARTLVCWCSSSTLRGAPRTNTSGTQSGPWAHPSSQRVWRPSFSAVRRGVDGMACSIVQSELWAHPSFRRVWRSALDMVCRGLGSVAYPEPSSGSFENAVPRSALNERRIQHRRTPRRLQRRRPTAPATPCVHSDCRGYICMRPSASAERACNAQLSC